MFQNLSHFIRDRAFGVTLFCVLVGLIFSPTVGGALWRGTVLALYALVTGAAVSDGTIHAFLNFHW